MMTVKQLREKLADFPDDFIIHLDVSNHDRDWEGDRVVRGLAGLRVQAGYLAVALDADVYSDEEDKNFPVAEDSHR